MESAILKYLQMIPGSSIDIGCFYGRLCVDKDHLITMKKVQHEQAFSGHTLISLLPKRLPRCVHGLIWVSRHYLINAVKSLLGINLVFDKCFINGALCHFMWFMLLSDATYTTEASQLVNTRKPGEIVQDTHSDPVWWKCKGCVDVQLGKGCWLLSVVFGRFDHLLRSHSVKF